MASATDVFARASNGTRPTPTTLTAILASGSSPGTATCAALTGWPTTSKVHFCIYTINTSGAKVAGSQTDWVGVVSGSTITGLTLKAGTNVGYSVGAVVEASPIAAFPDDLFVGLTKEHSATDGSHTTITASGSITAATGLTVTSGSVTLPNNSITGAALSASAITLGYAQITTTATAGTTIAAISGLTATVTVPAGGRRIKITVYARDVFSTSGGVSNVTLWEGTVGSGTQLQEAQPNSPAGSASPTTLVYVSNVAPSAGSHTYNVGLKATAGTANFEAAATAPAFLLVELI